VIRTFKHKGLKLLFTRGQTKGVAAGMTPRIRRVLDAIDAAESPQELIIPGFGTHPLKGNRKGTWAIMITGNWRITFKFVGIDVIDVNLEDYH
jgi:toxin HigB-1